MSLNVTQSNNNLKLQVNQNNLKATLSVTQSVNELHITAIQNNEIVKLQPVINTNASDFTETDPIFQASEASLFIAGDKANLDNQSGINSGDETTLSIQTKRPLKTVNNESLEGSGNVQIDYNDLDNLPVIPTPISNHSELNLDDGTNPHGTTKSDVGLSNVDNTSDIDKPISTETQNALNNKADLVGGKVPLIQLPEIIDELYRSWFSYTPNNAGSWLVVNTGNSLTISGTSTVVPRAGTTIYGSIIMNNCISATPNGSNAGIKNNNASDGTYREGVDAYFIWANNDVNNQCCASVGLYSLLSTPPNLNPSNFTASTMICANDQGESNLSFMVNRTAILSNFIKIDCGSDFPAHSTNDAYLLRIQINKTENQNERIGKMTIYNIVTGKTFSHNFTGLQMPDSNSNFSVMINRGNRNTGVATNIRPAKIYCNRKLY